MQVHNPTYCCSTMQTWIENNVVVVDYITSKAHMNVLHTPTPVDDYDPEPTIERIDLVHCPNCGDAVMVYSEPVPAPTYTRATVNGGDCDDITCRYLDKVALKCLYAFRSTGCYSVDNAVKIAHADLRANVMKGFSDFTSE